MTKKHHHTSQGSSSTSASSSSSSSSPSRVSSSRGESRRRLLIVIAGAIVTFTLAVIIRWYSPPSSSSSSSSSSPLTLSAGRHVVPCSSDYPRISTCSPPKSCARIVVDDFINEKQIKTLRKMAAAGMQFGQGSGGPTIFDVATGAASEGEKFVDAYKLMQAAHKKALEAANTFPSVNPLSTILSRDQINLYKSIMQRVKSYIESELGVSNIYLTKPSFFSRITSAPAKTEHDEYWHPHVDKKQYGSFLYTALIYLSTQGEEFEGGSFHFIDGQQRISVQPKRGRLVVFTSGDENVHAVEKVKKGNRYALTIAFTCDKKQSVEDNLLSRAEEMLSAQSLWESERRYSPGEMILEGAVS